MSIWNFFVRFRNYWLQKIRKCWINLSYFFIKIESNVRWSLTNHISIRPFMQISCLLINILNFDINLLVLILSWLLPWIKFTILSIRLPCILIKIDTFTLFSTRLINSISWLFKLISNYFISFFFTWFSINLSSNQLLNTLRANNVNLFFLSSSCILAFEILRIFFYYNIIKELLIKYVFYIFIFSCHFLDLIHYSLLLILELLRNLFLHLHIHLLLIFHLYGIFLLS